jgi:hypothetical protein
VASQGTLLATARRKPRRAEGQLQTAETAVPASLVQGVQVTDVSNVAGMATGQAIARMPPAQACAAVETAPVPREAAEAPGGVAAEVLEEGGRVEKRKSSVYCRRFDRQVASVLFVDAPFCACLRLMET